jgi:hypothetical protein
MVYIRCVFVDSNILRSEIYKSHECSGALVEAPMKYDSEREIQSVERKRRCRRVNIRGFDLLCMRIRGTGG